MKFPSISNLWERLKNSFGLPPPSKELPPTEPIPHQIITDALKELETSIKKDRKAIASDQIKVLKEQLTTNNFSPIILKQIHEVIAPLLTYAPDNQELIDFENECILRPQRTQLITDMKKIKEIADSVDVKKVEEIDYALKILQPMVEAFENQKNQLSNIAKNLSKPFYINPQDDHTESLNELIKRLKEARSTSKQPHPDLYLHFNKDQLSAINDAAQKMLENRKPYVHNKKIKATLISPKLFALTKKDGKIYIHKKEINSGATKTAKLVVCYQTAESFARMRINNPAKASYVLQERELLRRTIGLKGVIQAHSVDDIKETKSGKDPKGFILEYFPNNMRNIGDLEIHSNYKIAMLRQAAEGIFNLHGAGIIHRDIKPENIVANYNKDQPQKSVAKIADLDLSICRDNQKDLPWKFEYEIINSYAGTPGFMAPEMLNKNIRSKYLQAAKKYPPAVDNTTILPDNVDFELGIKMDIYSFGKTIEEVLFKHPSVRNDKSLKHIKKLVADMTQDNPWERPSMKSVLERLVIAP